MTTRPYSPHRAPDTLEPAPDWRTDALCARLAKPDAMYPNPTDTQAVMAARSVCAACPVLAACLQDALAEEGGRTKGDRYGVRAGFTPYQRFALYQRARLSVQQGRERTADGDARAHPCGTRAAALRHKRYDEELDEPCLDAYDAYLQTKAAKARNRRETRLAA